MTDRDVYARRTGVAFLSLVLATNCISWIKLVEVSQSDSIADLMGTPAEFNVAVGTCFLAAVIVILAWFSGRRLTASWAPQVARPRDVGLILALAAAALNLALTGVIQWLGINRSLENLRREAWLFAAVWYLLVLPTQTVAAYSKGRASIPVPRSVSRPAGA